MIDIHCHILPGVDDGPQTMEESIAIARQEAAGGTTLIFATSHVMDQRDIESLPMRAELLAEVQANLTREGIPIELRLGAEVFPFTGVLPSLPEIKALRLGGDRYLLVDLPLSVLPNDFDEIVYQMQVSGASPIMAHPERVSAFQSNPHSLSAYLDRGVAIQVNAGSLQGQYGPEAQRIGFELLELGWVQFLGSDCHRASRRPKLQSGAQIVEEQFGRAYANFLTVESPKAVAEGRILPPIERKTPKKQTWVQKLGFKTGRQRT